MKENCSNGMISCSPSLKEERISLAGVDTARFCTKMSWISWFLIGLSLLIPSWFFVRSMFKPSYNWSQFHLVKSSSKLRPADIVLILSISSGWVINTMVDNSTCNAGKDLECRDDILAIHLKLIAIGAILLSGAFGIALPFLGRKVKYLKPDGIFFIAAKAFAAGVILATGFVHMIPDGMKALGSPCLPALFGSFPFSGFIALLAAMGTLIADVLATEYYERKQTGGEVVEEDNNKVYGSDAPVSSLECLLEKEVGHSDSDHMHIVGMRAHAASHSHTHDHSCVDTTLQGEFQHLHASLTPEDTYTSVRHVVISQVLEFGIALHSVIIGVSLGVSQSPCTIHPLLAALSFHQFFEGFALGGCISQAGFRSLSSVFMALCFALTTPLGISIGMGVASGYNSNSTRALVLEGVFDSISAGILIYMALVDLIAADFLRTQLCCNRQLQMLSYTALFLGAISMSLLAIWV